MTYANGTSETYTYNLANWITGLTNTGTDGTISSWEYWYYASGNLWCQCDQDNAETCYFYDGLGRLTEESADEYDICYTYDRSGNRTQMVYEDYVTDTTYTTTYTYDEANRLMTETKTQGATPTVTLYTYDANGNMLSKLQGYAGLTYWYNGRNQIIKAASNGITVGVYTYNADGIRTAKQTVNGTTYFLLDGGYVTGEATASAVTTTYLYGANLIRSETIEAPYTPAKPGGGGCGGKAVMITR